MKRTKSLARRQATQPETVVPRRKRTAAARALAPVPWARPIGEASLADLLNAARVIARDLGRGETARALRRLIADA